MKVKAAFEKLSPDRQQEIIKVCMDEFSEHGYRNTSTNSIVRRLGMAKGSLFNYFGSKEQLYLYLLHRVGKEMLQLMESRYRDMPADICERLHRLVETSLEYCQSRPEMYRFFLQFAESGEVELQRKYTGTFSPEEQTRIFYNLFQNVDTSRFRFDAERTFLLVRWLFAGLKMDLINELNLSRDASHLKEKLLAKLDLALEALRVGIYIADQEK
jgi:AcrR family transcriptional regulator